MAGEVLSPTHWAHAGTSLAVWMLLPLLDHPTRGLGISASQIISPPPYATASRWKRSSVRCATGQNALLERATRCRNSTTSRTRLVPAARLPLVCGQVDAAGPGQTLGNSGGNGGGGSLPVMLGTRVIGGRRALVVAVAAVLFVAIFVLRLAVADPDAAILLLCVAPTALLASEFGLRGGLAAAVLSLGLVGVWAESEAPSVGAVGYVTRAVTFLLVGGLIGWFTDRRGALEEQNTRQFELSLDLLGVAGFDGFFKRVNPAFERALGYSAEEFCSRPFLELVHPEDRERTAAEAAKLAEVGTDTINFQNRYRAKDGSYRWIEWTTRAVASEQLLYAAARDITDRKSTERYLESEHGATRVLADSASSAQASSALLRVIGAGMGWPVGVFWTPTGDGPNAELHCTAVWQGASATSSRFVAASEQLRLSPGTGLPGRVWQSGQARWVPDVTLEAHFLRVEEAIADGLHACFLLPVPGSSGVLAVMEFLSHEVRPPDPSLLQMLTTLAGQVGQFLERERAETALAASERETRQILTAAHDAFVAMDSDGVITDWNPQAEATFGWPREEALGRDLADTFIPESYREAHRRGLAHFLASGEGPVLNRLLELTAVRRDGREFPVELTISPIRTATGYSFNAFLRDISERKRIEEELAVARDQALEASRLKSEFLATMSHEIRTPMNGVIGMTGLLLDTELEPKQREYAEAVRRSGETLLAIINDILDFSKIEAGRMELEIIDFDLRTVVEEVGDLLAEMAHAKGLELVTLLPPEIPTGVQGDPGRLRQVLTNLVANAVKFTETGEVVVRAEIVDETAGEALVRFEVADTGIGIAPAAQAAIFEAFSQADSSTTRSHGGTGLGLAISKQLVERMGGQVTLDSELGRGSRFGFTVRLRTQPEQRTDLPRKRAHLAGLRVLVADDNATNRQILEHQVTSWGMDSGTTEGGPAALEMLRGAQESGARYDVVLLDMHMPGMDGLELARAIRDEPALAAVRLVLLTSWAVRGSAEAAREAGISAYLTKPVRQSQLYDALATVIGAGTDAAPLVTRHTLTEDRARSRPRLLVVEDNDVNQEVAVGMLTKLGYRADVAANGIEAVDAVARFSYGAVLMDCQMPELDGYAATAAIREREQGMAHVPIIAMTAGATKGEREKCLAAGMDDYVSKPVAIDELGQTLERWIAPGDGEGLLDAPPPDRDIPGGAFDPDVVASLRSLTRDGQPDAFVSLTTPFASSGAGLLETLREALARDDAEAVGRVAHTLKGSAANLGALRLADACRQLEEVLSSDMEVVGAAVTRVEAEFEQVQAWLAGEPGSTTSKSAPGDGES
jgi:two-component system sensor histidine kinase/response regulator